MNRSGLYLVIGVLVVAMPLLGHHQPGADTAADDDDEADGGDNQLELALFGRRGIGSLLMRDALRRLRERGAAGCVLLGNPAYYARFGFMPEPSLVLPGVPPEYFQALRFDGPWPRGVVTYHAAFEAGS